MMGVGLGAGVRDQVYLDVAGVGIVSTRVQAAMAGVLADHGRRGIGAAAEWRAMIDRTRALAAEFVGGGADRVAFTQNASTGLALVVNGIDWFRGEKRRRPSGGVPVEPLPVDAVATPRRRVRWLSVEEPFAFDHEPRLGTDARRFESGTENAAGIAGRAAIATVLEIGREAVETTVLDRGAELADMLAASPIRAPARILT